MASEIVPVSYGPFQRLERLASPPDNRKSRMWAGILILLCGYRPEEFDLSMDDVPEALRNAAIARNVLNMPDPGTPSDQEISLSGWNEQTGNVRHIGVRSAPQPEPVETERRVA